MFQFYDGRENKFLQLQQAIPYSFNNINYLKCAVVLSDTPVSFSHLECIGDSLLTAIVKTTLAINHPDWQAGNITEESKTYLRNLPCVGEDASILMKIAEGIGLKAYFGMCKIYKGRMGLAHTLSSAVEAVIGAVFYDSNNDLKAVENFVLALFAPYGLTRNSTADSRIIDNVSSESVSEDVEAQDGSNALQY